MRAQVSLYAVENPWCLWRRIPRTLPRRSNVPVVEREATGVKVTVGSVPHPMDENHYIEWVQVIADGKAYREFLAPRRCSGGAL